MNLTEEQRFALEVLDYDNPCRLGTATEPSPGPRTPGAIHSRVAFTLAELGLVEISATRESQIVALTETGHVIVAQLRAERAGARSCRVCGCTDDRACPGGCWWVAPDLCSACQ